MTPAEKLKEIEECVSTRSGDIEWLITRVKRLTEALETIGQDKFLCGKFGLNFEGYCLYACQVLNESSELEEE